MPSRPVPQTPSYYEILQLSHSEDSKPLTRDDVKAAYHRALLIHHPDKATTRNASAEPIAPRSANHDDDHNDGSAYYTIDQIVGARHVLSYGGKVLTCELVPGKSTTRFVDELRGKAGNS